MKKLLFISSIFIYSLSYGQTGFKVDLGWTTNRSNHTGEQAISTITDLPTTLGIKFDNGGNLFGSNSSLGNNDNYSLNFKTNNANRLIIQSNGNIFTNSFIKLSLGAANATSSAFRNALPLTGSTVFTHNLFEGAVQSDVSQAQYLGVTANTATRSDSLQNLFYLRFYQGTLTGAVKKQVGLYVDNMSGAIQNYLIQSAIPYDTGNYHLKLDGKAKSYFGGRIIADTIIQANFVPNNTGDIMTITSGGILSKRTGAQLISDLSLSPATGGTGYIQNTTTTQSANFTINGTGHSGSGFRAGISGNPLTIPIDGGNLSPLISAQTSSNVAGISVSVSDGVDNRRAALYIDDTNSVWGLAYGASGATMPFQVRTPTGAIMQLASTGINNATGEVVTIDNNNFLRKRTAAQIISDGGGALSTSIGNGTLTLATSGIATGSASFTANQSGNTTFTVNVPPVDSSVFTTKHYVDSSIRSPYMYYTSTSDDGVNINPTYRGYITTNTSQVDWYLPDASTCDGYGFFIINKGTDNLIVHSYNGESQIWGAGALSDQFTLIPGELIRVFCDGVNFLFL